MGAYDVFDFAFRKGEAIGDLTDLEGKTIVLGIGCVASHLSIR